MRISNLETHILFEKKLKEGMTPNQIKKQLQEEKAYLKNIGRKKKKVKKKFKSEFEKLRSHHKS